MERFAMSKSYAIERMNWEKDGDGEEQDHDLRSKG
jgi:hypothetical protein